MDKIVYDIDMLHQIEENVDLLEYVGQSMELEKRGDDYYGHCPKHIDNTPSFAIFTNSNSFYCFSCHRSGRIISYLREYDGLGFHAAVQKAANLANIDLNKMCKSATVAFLKALRNTSKAKIKTYEHAILPEKELDKYSNDLADEWIEEGMLPEVLRLFGVRLDVWGNRVVYPVRDFDGRLINIKGRTRYKEFKKLKIPKYINYYPVGVMDYFQCLDITFPYIRERNEVIIFESIKSVMKAYGWGYKNCVSAEKHSLTPEQITLLAKLRVDIVFAYDSDVSYAQNDVQKDINKLKRMTNVYIITDAERLLGGAEAKNAPVDVGKEIWERLYHAKRKIV